MKALRALLVASAVLLFVDLGGSTIWDANEAFYVETPKQMVLSGDYINPSFNGRPRVNKPVLSYWIVAAAYRAFGVSVTTERVTIAIGALLLIGATYVIGRVVGGADAGVVAALVLASAPRVMLWSRRIFIDVWVTAFLAAALMFYLLATRAGRERPHRGHLIGMYAAIGFAMLTKGPVALVLPGLALLGQLLWTRRLGMLRWLMVPAGLLIIAAIVAPWYIADYQQHGWENIKGFFIGENLDRFTETVGVQSRGPFFYVPVLLTDLTPWSLLLPAAVVAAWRARRDDVRLLLVWIAAFVGVFSLSQTKQDLYIFPAAPAIAALIGALVVSNLRSRLAWMGAALSGFLLAALGGLLVYVTLLRHAIALPQAGIAGVALVVGGIASAVVAARRPLRDAAVALAGTAVVANWVLVLLVMRPFEQFKPVAPMSAWLRANAGDAPVVHFMTQLPSMTYYLGRPVTQMFDLPSMDAFIDAHPLLYVVARPNEIADVQASTAAPICVLRKAPLPLFDAKLSQVVSGNLPEVWLVGVKGACK